MADSTHPEALLTRGWDYPLCHEALLKAEGRRVETGPTPSAAASRAKRPWSSPVSREHSLGTQSASEHLLSACS